MKLSDFPKWLYLIEAVGQGVVKIGISDDVSRRLNTMQTANHAALRVLGVAERADCESEIHEAMKAHHVRGEWFRWNAESKALLEATCRALGFDFEAEVELTGRHLDQFAGKPADRNPGPWKMPSSDELYDEAAFTGNPLLSPAQLRKAVARGQLTATVYGTRRLYEGRDLLAYVDQLVAR